MTTTTEVKERPILMHGRSVRGILDGSKTQTRRIVKPQPHWNGARWVWPIPARARRPGCSATCVSASREWHQYMPPGCCPYGEPRDRLYVRETFRTRAYGPLKGPFRDIVVEYAADEERRYFAVGEDDLKYRTKDFVTRPSIHMPKWAARIWLEITDVRVERVQEITNGDALAEGVPVSGAPHTEEPWRVFAHLWDDTNAHRDGCTWEDNPYVWVIAFRRIEP